MSAGGDRWLPGLVPASSCSQSGSRDGEGQARPEEGGGDGGRCPGEHLSAPAAHPAGRGHCSHRRCTPGPLLADRATPRESVTTRGARQVPSTASSLPRAPGQQPGRRFCKVSSQMGLLSALCGQPQSLAGPGARNRSHVTVPAPRPSQAPTPAPARPHRRDEGAPRKRAGPVTTRPTQTERLPAASLHARHPDGPGRLPPARSGSISVSAPAAAPRPAGAG